MDHQSSQGKFIFDGTPEMMAHLQALLASGELDARLGVSVVKLQAIPASQPINLGQWLMGKITMDWQFLDALQPSEWVEVAVRSQPTTTAVSAVRWLPYQAPDDQGRVALMVTVEPDVGQKRRVAIALHPDPEHPYLPVGLQLALSDQTQALIQSMEVPPQEKYIQLRFGNTIGTPFHIDIRLEHQSLAQAAFII